MPLTDLAFFGAELEFVHGDGLWRKRDELPAIEFRVLESIARLISGAFLT